MSTGHVFVVASGFGKRVIPKAPPCTFALEGQQTLAVEHRGVVARVEALQSVIDAVVAVGVADVSVGPAWPEWWLEAGPYRVPLPQGWTAHVSGGVAPSVFDLIGPHESLIFIQVPKRVPELDAMVAPGQERLDRGAFSTGEWIAVGYSADGREYVQRHALVRIEQLTAVVTLQCEAAVLARVTLTHQRVAEALRPGGAYDGLR